MLLLAQAKKLRFGGGGMENLAVRDGVAKSHFLLSTHEPEDFFKKQEQNRPRGEYK